MKRTINLLGWIGVIFTILALILTLLTTYHFTYVKYFNDYCTLQWSIFVTMVAWAINMIISRANFRNIVYPITCVLIACATMFFMYMKVY
ncbi:MULTISPECIES: hypothetical protein [Clostridium]|jgi:putative effector of murein hydrolase|uniref:Uncharacterized protein n=5 Tax=Clostridium TaxID=1485 RepID=A0A168MP39_9CLOT|nr:MULTISPECIES: hypothetical protein [Clostridium]ADK16722.1 putative membrane protein [Clostridium ljungdahlii DSM 13528]AGY75780.1 hypothetical protein CAETHG_1557 [Clostridium autoethanogenum DSM 10061]ALU35945.1 Hypothetical protein CLAU_1516 [Clostridium autoethanogenum DSM 10061]OAA84967.1 hypothetical protein WY13_02885 [Clostridium ljungdahlii]OAA89402.1 hypothetical protein WX45_01219 [Clostridium ljungdahlii DSM 13528]